MGTRWSKSRFNWSENVEFWLSWRLCVSRMRYSEGLDARWTDCDLGCLGDSTSHLYSSSKQPLLLCRPSSMTSGHYIYTSPTPAWPSTPHRKRWKSLQVRGTLIAAVTLTESQTVLWASWFAGLTTRFQLWVFGEHSNESMTLTRLLCV